MPNIKKYTEEVLDKLAISLKKWVKDCYEKDQLCLLAEWCFVSNFHPGYFKRYTSVHDKFREAHAWAKAFQEFQVAKGALTKNLDPRFSQFFLGCQHGWRSKDDAEAQKRDLRNDFSKFLSYIKDEAPNEDEVEDDE